ncbi:hypothetical protein ZWY2020_018446 [Hordeum vulgare]|nr:hypothetical protein ZWY2020_018446 [Hordeum vulgare]
MGIAGIRSDLAEIGGRVRKVGSFLKDGMEVLDTMCEVSPREEIVESYPIGFERISNSGDELKLIHTEICFVPGYQNDLAVTNVDSMLKSIAEDNCSKDILVKDGAIVFSCEARVEQQEDICNRESATEVPTNYQVSTSQEHVTLLMDQVPSTKDPFDIDDTRSDYLFELASGYHLEAPNVFESEQEVDSTSHTISNQTSAADGKHYAKLLA